MGQRDRAQTPPADDQFFRQLVGEGPVDAQGAPPAPESPEATASTSGPIDPHAAHPIDPPEKPQPPRRRIGQTPRQHAARRRASASSAHPHRLLAASALAVGALAVATVVLGADQSDAPQATAAGPRGAPNGSPTAEDARLAVWWSEGGKSLRERWRRDGETTIAGRLTSGEGQAVAGASVTVLAADATRPQEGNRTVGEVRTDREGRFEAAIALDLGTPRKQLTFSYLARANDTVPAAEARATLTVITPISLRADRREVDRGQAVGLDGSSAPGAQIALLARPPDSDQWQKLADVQADRDGGWQASVRAPRDARAGRWRFRARVADSREDGFIGAQSDPVSVGVR